MIPTWSKTLFDKAHEAADNRKYRVALLGRHNPSDDTVSFEVAGRLDMLWVTIPNKGVVPARNEAGVPQVEDLQVKVYLDHGTWTIAGRSTRGELSQPTQTPPSGVLTHTLASHTDVSDVAPASGDVLQFSDFDGLWSGVPVNALGLTLDDLNGVTITAPASGDALLYLGGDWVNSPFDERAQDAVGLFAIDTATIDFTYTDATPEFKWDVKNASITYAKIQNVSATDKLLGRATAGAGPVEEIALTAFARTLIDDVDAAAMRTTLGLVIGTNVQAFDAELAAIAGLTSAADKLPYFTGSGTASLADLSAFARTLIDDAAAVNMRATLGLVIGTDVQAQDAELAAIAGLTSAADRLPYFTGLGTAALATFTAFGRTLAALADAAAGIAALGLDAIYGRLAAANIWSGTNKFDADVTLSPGGTQDYVFSNRSASLTLQGQTSGGASLLEIYAKDGDGSDSVQGQFWGVGTPASVTNRERLLFGWDATNGFYFFNTEKAGTGTLRALHIYTGANTDQLVAATDGTIGVGVAAPAAQLDVLQPTLGSPVQQLASTATNDDPAEIVYQNRVATTNATVTTLHTFTVPATTTYMIIAYVVARRTGGASGTAEDGAGYLLQGVYKNVAGTATIIAGGTITTIIGESQAGWDATLDVTGATVRARVTGATGNNISWHMTARVYMLGS